MTFNLLSGVLYSLAFYVGVITTKRDSLVVDQRLLTDWHDAVSVIRSWTLFKIYHEMICPISW